MRPPAKRREGRIAQWLSAEKWQLPSLFSEVQRFYLHLLNHVISNHITCDKLKLLRQ
jgi:hypothetical protein